MKKYDGLLMAVLLISGCSILKKNDTSNKKDYGVFLGAANKDKNKIKGYKNIAIEVDEFKESSIKELRKEDIDIYAYLSVGSLETYRDYYEEYKQYTFMEYDNWPDEYWIDVSNANWQNLLADLSISFKDRGATGLFLDNFDVYYHAKESDKVDEEDIYQGCRTILNNLSSLNMDITINSGTDFLKRLYEEKDPLINKITWYAQETVFSSIIDYEENIFGEQDKEEREYYISIINMMKKYSDILLIEYTKDETLIKEIEDYCDKNHYSCYITDNVNLEA